MKLKKTDLVRRGDILNCGAGITKHMLRKVIESKVLKPIRLKGYKIFLFRRVDVVKVFGLESES